LKTAARAWKRAENGPKSAEKGRKSRAKTQGRKERGWNGKRIGRAGCPHPAASTPSRKSSIPKFANAWQIYLTFAKVWQNAKSTFANVWQFCPIFANVWQIPDPGRKTSILVFANVWQIGGIFANVWQNGAIRPKIPSPATPLQRACKPPASRFSLSKTSREVRNVREETRGKCLIPGTRAGG